MEDLLNIPESEDTHELKWYQIVVCYIVAFPLMFMFLRYANSRQRFRRRLKYFNPVIIEDFWGERTKWVGRDKPLTDEEVNNLVTNENNQWKRNR